MPSLIPRQVTHDTTVRALERGHAVHLDEPGWSDTARRKCPKCDRLVMGFTGHRSSVLFEYGIELARPHQCDQVIHESRDWKVARIERLQREIDQLRQQVERRD